MKVRSRREAAGDRAIERLLAMLPDDRRAAAAVAATVEDWPGLFDRAWAHGVEDLLLHYAQRDRWPVPEAARAAPERRQAGRALWAAHARVSLREAILALQDAQIDALVLKGPALAERLYPDPALRPSIDLDLLIEPARIDAAAKALMRLGYRAETGPTARYARAYQRQVHLERPQGPPIEIHAALYAGFGTTVPAEPVVARSAGYVLENRARCRILDAEDEALYLAVHAAGHSFIRMMWLYDLKLVLRAHPGLHWESVVERARSSELTRSLHFALRVLESRLRWPVPVRPGRQQWNVVSHAAWRLLPLVSTPSRPSTLDNLGGLLFTALLCDRTTVGARLIRHHVLRSCKRRAQRLMPGIVPEEWSA